MSRLWISLALSFLTLAAYYPVQQADFVNLDDPLYVTENQHIGDGLTADNLRWAWSTGPASATARGGYFQPLLWMSFQLDATLFGREAFGFHLSNLVLHTAAVVLLFLVLSRMTGCQGRSAVVAGLFALHPLHVESVAWVTERKDVLSALAGLLVMAAYASYAGRPSTWRYLLVVVTYGLSLLTKPMLVTLPCALLLVDYWPLRRWGGAAGAAAPAGAPAGLPRLLLEKLPLLALAAVACAVLLLVPRPAGALVPLERVSLVERLANACAGLAFYMNHTFWPFGLAAFYPLPNAGWTLTTVLAGVAWFLGPTLLALATYRRCPALLIGWLWFLGALVPVIGLVQAGDQAFADRFSYWPHIGLFVGLVWGTAGLLKYCRWPPAWQAGLAILVLLGLAVRTCNQAGHWRDSERLWLHALEVTRDNHRAHANLGQVYYQRHELGQAAFHYARALQLRPDFADRHNTYGTLLVALGQRDQALDHFHKAVLLWPDLPDARHNLGGLLLQEKRAKEALPHLEEAVALRSDFAPWRHDLAAAFLDLGRPEQAVPHLEAALRLSPAPDLENRIRRDLAAAHAALADMKKSP